MDYKEITNDELFAMFLEHNEYAEELLFKRFKIIINSTLKKYNSIVKHLKLNNNDLNSEALYGIMEGLNCYQNDKNASINTFISLCVERRLCKYLTKENQKKNKINNEALPIDELIFNSFIDVKDPLKKLLNIEDYYDICNKAKRSLSIFEYQVFNYKIQGYKTKNIALFLQKSPIQVGNAYQRIKKKLKNS